MINTYHPITIHYIYTPSPLCHRHPNPIAGLSMVLKKTRWIPECTLPPTSSNLWLTPPPTSSYPWHHHTHPLLRPSKTGAKWNLSTTQRPAVKNPLYILTCVYLFTASILTSPHAPLLRPSRIGAKWWEHSTKRQAPLEMQISWTTIWAIGLIGVPITTTTRRTRTPPMNKLCSTYTPIIGRATFLIG